MTRFLLDTNIVSELAMRPMGVVANKARRFERDALCTSIIVAAEIRFGLDKRGSPALAERVTLVLEALDILPFEASADREYGRIRAALEARGEPIGANDLLIAAHVLALGYSLVTLNVREFERVPGLQVTNWLP